MPGHFRQSARARVRASPEVACRAKAVRANLIRPGGDAGPSGNHPAWRYGYFGAARGHPGAMRQPLRRSSAAGSAGPAATWCGPHRPRCGMKAASCGPALTSGQPADHEKATRPCSVLWPQNSGQIHEMMRHRPAATRQISRLRIQAEFKNHNPLELLAQQSE